MCTVHSATWPLGHLATRVRGARGVRPSSGRTGLLERHVCTRLPSNALAGLVPLPSRQYVGRARATGTDNLIKRDTSPKRCYIMDVCMYFISTKTEERESFVCKHSERGVRISGRLSTIEQSTFHIYNNKYTYIYHYPS